jgi:hypothetical protein
MHGKRSKHGKSNIQQCIREGNSSILARGEVKSNRLLPQTLKLYGKFIYFKGGRGVSGDNNLLGVPEG